MLNYFAQLIKKHKQSAAELSLRGWGDNTVRYMRQFVTVDFDNTIAGVPGAGIYAKHKHLGAETFHFGFGNIEIGIDMLYVIQIFQALHQAQHLFSRISLDRHSVVGNP